MRVGSWLLALLSLLVALPLAAESLTKAPNVFLLLADDLNDWVGCLSGHPDALTPSIDRLAKQGALFRQAYAASPKCNPSRTALLLGLRPSSTGIYGNGHWWRPHLPDAVSLPEAFRRAGYLTAGAGKIFHHTAGFNPPDLWDRYFALHFDDPWDRMGGAYPGMATVHPPPGHPLAGLEPFRHELDWGALPIAESRYGDVKTVEWASRFLAESQTEPFFLAVGLFRPHLPWYAPQRFLDAFATTEIQRPHVLEDDLDDVPEEGRRLAHAGADVFQRIRDLGKWDDAVTAYLASIAFADSLVGRLMDVLDSGPHARNTVVVFASDHGFHLGEKGHWYKSTLWERATHVPLIIRGPGLQAGMVCDRPVSLIDIYPTLLDLAGLPAHPDLDGSSLQNLLGDPEAEADRHAVITYLPGNHAVRRGRWLYIRYHDGGEELYDRARDPDETQNLAAKPNHRKTLNALRQLIPAMDSIPAPVKSDYLFDLDTYSWTPRR